MQLPILLLFSPTRSRITCKKIDVKLIPLHTALMLIYWKLNVITCRILKLHDIIMVECDLGTKKYETVSV